MRSSWVKVSGAELPAVLIGTSPFIGPGQFGPRALLYQARFFGKPSAVAEVISAAVELGVMGVQALPYPFIVEAIRRVEAETGLELVVVATLGPDDPSGDVGLFDGLDVRAFLIHGALTDGPRWPGLEELMEEARSSGALAGYVTHRPMRALERIGSGDLPRPDIIMLPFNAIGYMMDAPAEALVSELERLGLRAIAKKVLAAGRLRPEEAFRFVLQYDTISALAIGVASAREARETFGILADLLASGRSPGHGRMTAGAEGRWLGRWAPPHPDSACGSGLTANGPAYGRRARY